MRRFGPLLLVCLLALILRAGYGLTRDNTRFAWADEVIYFQITQELYDRDVYTYPPGSEPRVTQYPPAWPFFLAALRRAGVATLAEVRFLVAILSTLGVAGVALAAEEAARRIDPARARAAGIAAGLLAAFSPTSVFYAGTFLLETPFVALLGWLLWAVLRFVASPCAARGAALGALLALGSLLKSILYPLAMLAALATLLAAAARKIPAAAAGALLLSLVLVWSPWLLRNYGLTGAWVFTSQGGYTLYEANHPGADGGPRGPDEVWEVEERSRSLPEFEKNRAFRDAAIRWIRENPGDFIRLAARKLRRLWNPVPNRAELASSRFVWWVSLGWNVPLYLLALGGIWRARHAARSLWPIAVLPLFVSAIHSVFVSSIRYREPAVPSLLVLATLALLPYLRKS